MDVHFEKLEITPDDKYLEIKVSTTYHGEATKEYIQTIIIDSDDTYIPGGPSRNPVHTIDLSQGSVTEASVTLSQTDLKIPLEDRMFIVWVKSLNGSQEVTISKAVVNLDPVYKCLMNSVKEVENTCCIPKNFVNKMLRLKAISVSMITRNYTMAIKYWKKFFIDTSSTVTKCVCHG